MSTDVVIGLPWYREEDWTRLKAVFIDGDKLHDTFREWLREAGKLERKLQNEGHLVERIPIDPEDFRSWCIIRGRGTDANARVEFAMESVRLKHPQRAITVKPA
jgi:hypothetical protein